MMKNHSYYEFNLDKGLIILICLFGNVWSHNAYIFVNFQYAPMHSL